MVVALHVCTTIPSVVCFQHNMGWIVRKHMALELWVRVKGSTLVPEVSLSHWQGSVDRKESVVRWQESVNPWGCCQILSGFLLSVSFLLTWSAIIGSLALQWRKALQSCTKGKVTGFSTQWGTWVCGLFLTCYSGHLPSSHDWKDVGPQGWLLLHLQPSSNTNHLFKELYACLLIRYLKTPLRALSVTHCNLWNQSGAIYISSHAPVS